MIHPIGTEITSSEWLKVELTLQVAQGLGLLLGTAVMNPKTAQTIASITVLTMVLVGGYFVRGNSHSHGLCL